MAIPFRPLYGARPSVLPESANIFGQLTQGVTQGFAAGRGRAQEEEVPGLMTTGDRILGPGVIGDLMAQREDQETNSDQPWVYNWTQEQEAWFTRALRNPATREWANQVRQNWLANVF